MNWYPSGLICLFLGSASWAHKVSPVRGVVSDSQLPYLNFVYFYTESVQSFDICDLVVSKVHPQELHG